MSAVMETRDPSAKYLSALQPPLVRHFELMATAHGGVARLRELILTLAVQGKLVQQDPNDEPASELVKQIRSEKERLIADGKIKKDKPISEIEGDEVPFLTPKTWEWVRLGDVSSYIQRGKSPTYADHSAHRVISQKCVRWYGLDVEPARYITEDSLSKYEEVRFLQAGDLLWNSTGTGTIGRACLVEAKHADARLVADSHVTVVRPIKVISSFLWRWIQSPYVQDEIEGAASGTTNQIELNTSTVVSHLMPLPPLAEQSRIVARVEELMRLCDALEAKGQLEAAQHAQLVQTLLGALTASTSPIELADNWQRVATHFDRVLDRPEAIDALEQTILQLAVRGLLVSQDTAITQRNHGENGLNDIYAEKIDAGELPFEVPQNWRWVRLGSIAELINGDRGTNYPNKAEYVSTGLPFINTGHIEPDGTLSDGTMNFLTRAKFDSLRSGKTKPGDLVYCLRGATLGKTAIVVYPEGAIASSLVIIRPNEVLDRRYAYLYLTSPLGRSLVRRFDNGSAQPNLGAGNVRKYVVPLPPSEEQCRIVARVESLRCLCADLRQRLAARQTTQAHLAEAFIDEVA